MSLRRRQTYFPGKNRHTTLPKPEREVAQDVEELIHTPNKPKPSLISRRISRPAMRMSLKSGDNPSANYAPRFAVNHAGPGIVAQRKGQLRQMVFIKQVNNCTQSELQLLLSASHENILALAAAYHYKQSIYLVYSYLPVTLKELERWHLTIAQTATVCQAITQGLDYLHGELNTIHGDLHTGTVVVGRDGKVKIANIGESMLRKPTTSEKEDRMGLRKIVCDLLKPSAVLSDLEAVLPITSDIYDEVVRDFLERLQVQSLSTLLEPMHAYLQQAEGPSCLVGTVLLVEELRLRGIVVMAPEDTIEDLNEKF